MILRKTYSVVLSLDSDARIKVAGFIRIEADEVNFALPKSGPLQISGKLPNGSRDLIPDDWSKWSESLALPGAEDGTITIGIEGKSIAVTAFLVPDASWSMLTGYGIIYAQLGGRTISARVNVRGALQDREEVSTEPLPAPKPRAFRLQKIAEGDANWKSSGLGIMPDGKWLVCEYDNNSRTDVRAIVEGQGGYAYTNKGAETIDSPVWNADDVARMNQGRDCGCCAVENGRPITWRKSDGKWRAVTLPFSLRFSSQALYDETGMPIFFDAQRDAHPTIRNMLGETIHQFKSGKGIPYMAERVDRGLYAVSLCDHPLRGIVFSDGDYIPTKSEPRVLIRYANQLLVGAGDALYTHNGNSLEVFATNKLFAPSIDDACVGADATLWIVTSHDAIAALNPLGHVTWSTALPDGNKTGLFGSRVASRGERTLFVRNNQNRQNRWELFEVLPA